MLIYKKKNINILNDFSKGYARSYSNWDSSEESQSMQSRNYNVQKELNDLLEASTVESSSNWQSSAAALPDASSFKSKVTRRINNSAMLAGEKRLQQKLYKVAEEKLEKCKKPNGQELDKHCVGRTTGQVMQLIGAVENASQRSFMH